MRNTGGSRSRASWPTDSRPPEKHHRTLHHCSPWWQFPIPRRIPGLHPGSRLAEVDRWWKGHFHEDVQRRSTHASTPPLVVSARRRARARRVGLPSIQVVTPPLLRPAASALGAHTPPPPRACLSKALARSLAVPAEGRGGATGCGTGRRPSPFARLFFSARVAVRVSRNPDVRIEVPPVAAADRRRLFEAFVGRVAVRVPRAALRREREPVRELDAAPPRRDNAEDGQGWGKSRTGTQQSRTGFRVRRSRPRTRGGGGAERRGARAPRSASSPERRRA